MSGDQARPFVAIRPWLRAGLLRHLSPTASRILFLVVDHAGTDGYSYPSARLLARESGHAPKTIYGALRELAAIGCIQRKDGAEGRTRFGAGHRHPGPVYYWIGEFDDQAARRLRRLESERTTQGDPARFAAKMFPSQEHLDEGKILPDQEQLTGTSCSQGRPQDVPILGRQDVPEPGTYRAFGAEPSSEHPPFPPYWGNSGSEDLTADVSSNGSGKGTTKAAERMREHVRLFLEAEVTAGGGLKSLDHWQRWFPKQYDRAMIAEVFHEVQRAHPGARLT